MQTLISIQQWLHQSMSQGLGDIAAGDSQAVLFAVGAAVLFGALHALMPGHGKTVLISYHLGQLSRPFEGFLNGTILALTHVGLAAVLVLGGFTVISKAFAFGGRTPQFETASGVLIASIGAFLLWRSLANRPEPGTKRNGRTLAFATGLIPCPLTTFVLSYAIARGILGAGLLVTAAMAAGMVMTLGGVILASALARDRFMQFLARTEIARHRIGQTLEIGGSLAVLALGLWTLLGTRI